jgi:hypothetical protein
MIQQHLKCQNHCAAVDANLKLMVIKRTEETKNSVVAQNFNVMEQNVHTGQNKKNYY